MNVLVLYFSRGGNTRKIAEHVAEGIRSVSGVDAVLKSTQEVTKDDFLNAAGIVAGSPVYFGVMAADLKRVFDEFVGIRTKIENKVGAAFASSGFWAGGNETTIMSILQCMLIYGMIIVGDPMSATGHYGAASVAAPDEKAADTARKLGSPCRRTLRESGQISEYVVKMKWIVQCGIFAGVIGAILFGSAGRLDWGMAWAFTALAAAGTATTVLVIGATDPELMVERTTVHQNTKRWDRALMPLSVFVVPAVAWLVAGLDKRFVWSPEMPWAVSVAGLLVTAAGTALFVWAVASNRFFSSVVRIQHDRGHAVAMLGPYRYVRHPGYVGMIMYSLPVPLVLGSWWALIPTSVVIGLTVLRAALEDNTLQEELDGYRDYAERVTYRLVPGLW